VAQEVNRHTSRRIAIYNHKGGVGKTTLTINIAAALAALDKRVLLVDSDPQCNLTSYLVEESVVDDWLDNSDSDDGKTLWSGVKPIVEGVSLSVKPIRAVEPIDNLFLLPGDIRLSEFEVSLSDMWRECLQRRVRGFRGVSALSLLVNRAAERYDIDYIFYDSGPNIGALNRVILLDCDYFIIPAACDTFSARAIKTLGQTLRNWIEEWETIATLAPDDLYLLPGKPKFLGYIPQRFRIYRGQPSQGQSEYLPRIDKNINNEVVAVLKKIDPLLIPGTMRDYKLGQIKDFATLAVTAQTDGIPMWDVGNQDQRDTAREAFESIAQKIIDRTN
jgi:cellulose biosynthesis protein BcsQ